MKKVNGFSVNGKIQIGRYIFEVQTEDKGSSVVISSIFLNGRVVKQYASSVPPDESKEIYLKKFHEKAKKIFVSDLLTQKRGIKKLNNGKVQLESEILETLIAKIRDSISDIEIMYLEIDGTPILNKLPADFTSLLFGFVYLLNGAYGDLEVAVFPFKGKNLISLKGERILVSFLVKHRNDLHSLHRNVVKPLEMLVLEMERRLP